ncbi:Uma2 family endonuclease [Microcoleus sp. D3_18a_C4]|uniref:Uma2 family endonuclease n=1 Tax=unclassified Microcoleus TaxID=2642155 RepID=UPI002FD203AB
MTFNPIQFKISWEKLPKNFILDEHPLQDIDQPLLAAALRESLEIAGLILEGTLVASHLAICVNFNDKLVIKTPDLFYATNVQPLPDREIRRSYTPNLEGDIPAIVMEFLPDNPPSYQDEYSAKQTYIPGKWHFYEQILQAPIYVIFEPASGALIVYHLTSPADYKKQQPDANNRYWIAGVGLFLGVWQGTKAERTGYWLRWWDESGEMLLWGAEMVERERQRGDRLAAQLRAAGLEPEA